LDLPTNSGPPADTIQQRSHGRQFHPENNRFAIPLIFASPCMGRARLCRKHFGDATAYMLGRMTLNPIKHIDPVWTILVPILTCCSARSCWRRQAGASRILPACETPSAT
jgi:hypothetical protein